MILDIPVRNHLLWILGPGGYLQWLECDACDIWATPETPMTTAMSNYVISERVARGLLPASVAFCWVKFAWLTRFLELLHP